MPGGWGTRILLVLAGVLGASGIGLAALAAHKGGETLATAAYFLLFHAPALMAIAIGIRTGVLRATPGLLAGFLIAAGVIAFSGALALGALANWRPVPMLAPTGGMMLMAGWLMAGLSGLLARKTP